MIRRSPLVAALALALTLIGPSLIGAAQEPLPSSMAALGDSITPRVQLGAARVSGQSDVLVVDRHERERDIALLADPLREHRHRWKELQ
jgi:hypothetical protein